MKDADYKDVWDEYEAVAKWCAENNTDHTPIGISSACLEEIEFDQQAFADTVRRYAREKEHNDE